MPAATGFQIAFLVFAFEFFSMLAANALAPLLGWPASSMELLGQLITFSMAALVLLGIPRLRRYCVAELRVPVPATATTALVAASLIKLSIPFAVVGGVVIHAFATGNSALLASRIPTVDPVLAWESTLSPPGLLRLLLLSWFVGPVIEELVFRGLLYRAFERQWGWVVSMVLTSLLFGLAHPNRILAAALGSIVLIWLLRRTGSLRACVIVHVTYNVLISWPALGRLLFTAPEGVPTNPSTWAIPLACLAFASVAVPACIWTARRAALPDGTGQFTTSQAVGGT